MDKQAEAVHRKKTYNRMAERNINSHKLLHQG